MEESPITTTTIRSKGIYRGLPVFPSTGPFSAIVTGANGISGDHMVRVLDESPERWSNIYTLSRRPPPVEKKWKSNVKHVTMDFLYSSPAEMADKLKKEGVTA